MGRPKKGTKCIRPDCGKEISCRGLCGSCYNAAKACVTKGWATWERLEEQGKILPKQRGKYAAAWPWLMDWSEDPTVKRQIAYGTPPSGAMGERPKRKGKKSGKGGWPKGKPRKPKDSHVHQATTPPLEFTRAT